MDTGMSNRIAKYLEPEPDEDSKRVIASAAAFLAIATLFELYRNKIWNSTPQHLVNDVTALYESFQGQSVKVNIPQEMGSVVYEIMNSMGDVVTARYNELKGSK